MNWVEVRSIDLKIKKWGLITAIIILLCILIEYHFFYLFSYSSMMSRLLYDTRYALFAVLAIVLFIWIVVARKESLRFYTNWIKNYSVIALLSFCVLFEYSHRIYPAQKMIDTLAIGGRYASVLLAIPVMFLFVRDGGTKRFLTYLNAVVFLWYILTIIQSVVYAKTGGFLFSFRDYYLGDVNIRNSNIRVTQGTFGTIMFLYNACVAFFEKKKGKLFNIVMIILSLYHVVFVQQTRVMIIISTACLAFVVLFYGKNIRQQIFRATAILIAGVVLGTSSAVSEFIATFTSTSLEYSGSSVAREYAISYFIGVFFKNPLMGYGWPSDAGYSQIAHGSLGTAYTSDVGFIGLLAETGLFAIIFFLIPIIRMIYILFKTKKMPLDTMRMFLMVLIVYLLTTSATVIITDGARCLALPVIMALFEYYYASYIEVKNKHENIYY